MILSQFKYANTFTAEIILSWLPLFPPRASQFSLLGHRLHGVCVLPNVLFGIVTLISAKKTEFMECSTYILLTIISLGLFIIDMAILRFCGSNR